MSLESSLAPLCHIAITLNFCDLYAIPSIFPTNGVKWRSERTILPLGGVCLSAIFFFLCLCLPLYYDRSPEARARDGAPIRWKRRPSWTRPPPPSRARARPLHPCGRRCHEHASVAPPRPMLRAHGKQLDLAVAQACEGELDPEGSRHRERARAAPRLHPGRRRRRERARSS